MLNQDKTQYMHLGILFMKVLYHLIHTARIHKDNNELIKKSLAKFKGILNEMTKEDELNIQIWRGRFHICGEKLPYTRDTVNLFNEMMYYFTNRDIGGVNFLVTSVKALPEDLLTFIRLLDFSIKHEDPSDWLNRKLGGRVLSWVKIIKKQDDDDHDSGTGPGVKRRERAKNVYSYALDMVKEVAVKASRGIAGVRTSRRLAQTMVDLIHEDRSLILGLATIKGYDDYTYTHSVNVSLLATCLGKHIGLSKVALEHLSVCGLFHDLGKVGVPKSVLNKKGQLNAEEWKDMQAHPLLGVRKILRLNADKELRSKIVLGPFEHHLNPDMTGYPKTHFMKKLSLIGKILRIVDVYEAMTAERAYRPRSFTPDEALRKMWSDGEKSFDIILLKNFIQMMGIFPVGSTVELSDGRIALVMDYPEGAQSDLPLVIILEDDGNGGVKRGETINLTAKADKDGSPLLNITKGILPTSIGVSVSKFFLN